MIQYTLHKLSEGFIITSDEEIKEGYLGFDGFHTFKCLKPFIANETTSGKNIPCFYIELGSTSAFHETSYIKKVIAQRDQIDFSALSEEKQKEIGWFDVEKLALKYAEYQFKGISDKTEIFECKNDYLAGFYQAQELLSDRMFTLEDMIDFTRMCRENDSRKLIEDKELLQTTDLFEQWKSLSQPKSWKVKIEMENKIAEYEPKGCDFPDYIQVPKLTNGKIKILKLI
jgi:hypothetical protein